MCPTRTNFARVCWPRCTAGRTVRGQRTGPGARPLPSPAHPLPAPVRYAQCRAPPSVHTTLPHHARAKHGPLPAALIGVCVCVCRVK